MDLQRHPDYRAEYSVAREFEKQTVVRNQEIFLRWKAEAEAFSETKVKLLRTDSGGGYEK